jgi:hypothetical protein
VTLPDKGSRQCLSKNPTERAGVHQNTITNFETGKSGGDADIMRKLVVALEAAGVEFTNGDEPGVKLKKARRPATKPKKGD